MGRQQKVAVAESRGSANAIAKLDEIIEDTNDGFEAFQKEAEENATADKP